MDKKHYKKTKGFLKALSICMLLLLVFAVTANAQNAKEDSITKDDSITMLKEPPIVADSLNFKFIVFGDTRTADSSTPLSAENTAFKNARDMVIKDVVSKLTTGKAGQRPQFALFTADAIYHGSSPRYWNELKALIPQSLRTSPGKIFSILGNHELWDVGGPGQKNPEELYFETYPNLIQDNKRLHNYAFRIGTNLFVNLCSGGYDSGKTDAQNDVIWNCKVISSYQSLMNSLENLIQDQYKNNKIDKVIIQYHKPSFSNYQHPALGDNNNPYIDLSQFLNGTMKDSGIRVFIFNGHNHTTEFYEPQSNIWALVAGGGGAPQKPIASITPQQQGTDLFWKALGISDPNQRQRRVNYYVVDVNAGQIQIQEKVLGYMNGSNSNNLPGFKFIDGVRIDNSGILTQTPVLNFDSYMQYISNNETLVPIRTYVESLGGTVVWDAAEKKVTVKLNSTTIELWVGKINTLVDGESVAIDVSPRVVKGKVMVPLTYIVDNL